MSENKEKMELGNRIATGALGVATSAGAPFYAGIATVIGGPVLGAAVYLACKAGGGYLVSEAVKGEEAVDRHEWSPAPSSSDTEEETPNYGYNPAF